MGLSGKESWLQFFGIEDGFLNVGFGAKSCCRTCDHVNICTIAKLALPECHEASPHTPPSDLIVVEFITPSPPSPDINQRIHHLFIPPPSREEDVTINWVVTPSTKRPLSTHLSEYLQKTTKAVLERLSTKFVFRGLLLHTNLHFCHVQGFHH
jgi:hypothetical protein